MCCQVANMLQLDHTGRELAATSCLDYTRGDSGWHTRQTSEGENESFDIDQYKMTQGIINIRGVSELNQKSEFSNKPHWELSQDQIINIIIFS